MKKKMLSKNFLVAFLTASLFFCSGSFGIVNALETSYKVSMSDAVAAVGTTVTLDVAIDPGTNFCATQMSLKFDPSQLRYVVPTTLNVAKGQDLKAFELENGGGSMVINSNDALNGKVNIGYINMAPYTSGGNIFRVSFEVLPGAKGTIPVEFSVGELADYDGKAIPTTVKTGSVSIEVPLTGISLDKTSGTLSKGGTEQLAVVYNPDNTTDDKSVTWSSSNEQVATVSDSGLVKGIGGGSCQITATVGSYTASYAANVTVPLISISVNKVSTSIAKGESEQLKLTYNPTDTTDNKTVVWSSSNTSVATVDGNGLVKAIAKGNATIKATVGNKTAECAVTVKIPLTGISLNKTESSLKINGTESLAVTYSPSDTTDDKTVTWSSSDSSVATVSNGTVTALKAGKATITAKVGNFTAACVIKIGPSAPSNLKSIERTDKSVNLSWDVAQGAEAYNVYKDGVKVNSSPITVNQYKAEGLLSRTQYTFTVKSIGNGLESDSSSPVIVKTMGNPVNLTVGTAVGAAGKNIILKIDVSGNSTISASQLVFGFDSTKLEFVNAKTGSVAQGGTITNNPVGNEVTIGYMNLTPVTDQGSFLELEFKIKDAVGDQNLPITLTSKELVDEAGYDLMPILKNGEIQVRNIKLGDVNGDGEVKAFDALTALQIATAKIVPTANQKAAADIDGNGTVSAFEALRILQFATGKITTF